MERLPFFLRLLRRRSRAAAPYEVRWERGLEMPAADGSPDIGPASHIPNPPPP